MPQPVKLPLIALALAVAACSDGLPTEPITMAGDFVRSIELDGRTRTYLIHVPATVDLGAPAPLVIVFHGSPSTGPEMREIAELDAVAAAEGLVTVYPNASPTGDWNVACRDCTSAGGLEIDDLGLTERIIEKMSLDMSIDGDRVYVTGFSQGALMTFRVACRLAHRVAAVATVGATMLEWQGANCGPTRPVPIMMIHGSDDQEFPPGGRTVGIVTSLSVDATSAHWVATNGCAATPVVDVLPDAVADGTTVTRETWSGCSGGAETVLYRVEGGGHTWPGTSFPFSPALGVTSQDLAASPTIVEFFLRFGL